MLEVFPESSTPVASTALPLKNQLWANPHHTVDREIFAVKNFSPLAWGGEN